MTQQACSRLQDRNVVRSWKLLQKTHRGWGERGWWTSFPTPHTFPYHGHPICFPWPWAPSIYQKLWETSMERSIERGTCSIWRKFHSFMLSSPKFKTVTQISPWIAWNWWFLVKTCKWNMHFNGRVSKGKTGLPFQNSTYSREFFSRTHRKHVSD